MVLNSKSIELLTSIIGFLATVFVREFLESRTDQRY